MPEICDVAIIGGGVIGSAIAYDLSSEGRSVILVDAAEDLGLGASDAAMGGILTQTETACLGPLSSVIRRSRDLYEPWLGRLKKESGVEVNVLGGGDIQVALDRQEMDRLISEVLPRWVQAPFEVRQLTAAEARDLEPLLSDRVVGAFLLHEELALDPRELMVALRRAIGRSSVTLKLNTRAIRVDSGPNAAEVVLADGSVIQAGTVVVAAGYLSGRLLPKLADLIFPIKGEAFDLRPPGVTGYPLDHHVFAEIDCGDERGYPYLVPRHDGRVAVGVTYEENVFDDTPTAKGLRDIRSWTSTVMPATADWSLERHWAGLRPASPDHVPIIGYVDEHQRLLAATGHSGLGVTLAPVTAEMVADLIHGRTADPEFQERMRICSPDRDFTDPALSPAPTTL
ncbi:glycine oxidase ThiO [Acrocarpospora pleiomorpha]|uniref:Glycine oxidase ThiO n=1 Tax=Acrocarpospora pleiomorpha TaxID=90975 RepID=A0A5M3XIT7_9ACTN|nr:FAD-dependent oxidoreductase [Acrocarpospora pleiomorpha]GES19003.1 glycine oxidase ThiO [Acrocarpospora pleiomorpha]